MVFILTSPPPLPSIGFVDPSAPAYVDGTGFTPDAVRILTVASLQLALEHYRADHASYPATLADLFPKYAPLGQDGKAMSGPPAAADGYTYSAAGSGYTLSVAMANGHAYTVQAPARP